MHQQQAQHNLTFLDQSPDKVVYADWAVTTCFYVAVHYVDAWLSVAGGNHPSNHAERQMLANRCGNDRRCRTRGFPAMWRAYRELEDLSRKARYLCEPIVPEDVTRARDTYLAQVQRWLDGALVMLGCGRERI
jgi:hypothetical protein